MEKESDSVKANKETSIAMTRVFLKKLITDNTHLYDNENQWDQKGGENGAGWMWNEFMGFADEWNATHHIKLDRELLAPPDSKGVITVEMQHACLMKQELAILDGFNKYVLEILTASMLCAEIQSELENAEKNQRWTPTLHSKGSFLCLFK